MLCAGLDGCLDNGGKAMPRHSYQDKILDAVVDALETAETDIKTEVSEAEAALEVSQAAMVLCESARQKLELELAESSRSIEGQEKSLEDNADALEKTRRDLEVAEVALRHADTEIGEAAMRSHQISQVLRLVTSLSEKGAPDEEATKFLHDSRHLLELCAGHAAEHVTSALQDTKASFVNESAAELNAGKESPHENSIADQVASGEPESVSEQHLVIEQPTREQSEEQSKEEEPPSRQLAEELSCFSKCIADLDNMVSQTAAARILRVAEVTDAQAACSTMLSKRSEQSSELREAKQAYRQSEASMKSSARDMKQITAKCEACIESRDSAQERLKELQQGPLAKCRRLVATTIKVPANHSVNVRPQQESKCVHAEPGGDVEMRVELIKAGC